MSLLRPSLRPARRSIGADTSGVAMIEFAFALPLVIGLGLGGLEAANLALAHLRVSHLAMTVADTAARVATRVDEADINEVFAGARIVGEDMDFEANGRVVLSSLQDNKHTDGRAGQMINWQRCMGERDDIDPAYGVEDDGRDDNSLQGMGPTDIAIQAGGGTAVMFVEVSYDYQPLFPDILSPRVIRYETAYNVRERVEQDITNTTGVAVNSC